MTARLYVNAKGKEVRSHSYSGGDKFHFCARRYKLERIDGWREKKQTAAQLFGIALESALRFHHENGRSGGPEEFVRLWAEHQDKTELKYSPVERSWENLNLAGQEMLRLYDIRLPAFPIDFSKTPQFQVKYFKELFPGTEWAGIEFVAYIDMLCSSRASLGDQMIVDIKTSGTGLDQTPGILQLDGQLRAYAWITGVSDVAFLWFQKAGRDLERRTHVALLEDAAGDLRAGQHAVVIKYQDYEPAMLADPAKPRSKPKPEVPEETWIVRTEDEIERMFKECGSGQTKEEKEAREVWIRANATKVDKVILTRQRVDFRTANISLSDQVEAAEQVRRDVAAIVQADKDNFYPQQGGVRFPNNKCGFCSMRGICLNNAEMRDELVERTDEEFQVQYDAEESA